MMTGAIESEMVSRLGSTTFATLERFRRLLYENDDFSIPGVVVVGAQNAGKSSVLEALSGVKLPRGQSITTRVPLVLNLQMRPGVSAYAMISNEASRDEKLIEVEDVGREIEALTVKLAGPG